MIIRAGAAGIAHAAYHAGAALPTDPDQHFLVNRAVIDAIIDAADLRAGSFVAELGAGAGTVAARMPPEARMDLIELDPILCDGLRARFLSCPNVRVCCEDALAVLEDGRERYDVIFSNLPAELTPRVLDALAAASRVGANALDARPQPSPRRQTPPRVAIVAAPASLDLSPWKGQLDLSPIATARDDDFDPPQPFETIYLRVTQRKGMANPSRETVDASRESCGKQTVRPPRQQARFSPRTWGSHKTPRGRPTGPRKAAPGRGQQRNQQR